MSSLPAFRRASALFLAVGLLLTGGLLDRHEDGHPHRLEATPESFRVDHDQPEPAAHFESAERLEGSHCSTCLLRAQSRGGAPAALTATPAPIDVAAGRPAQAAARRERHERAGSPRAPPLG